MTRGFHSPLVLLFAGATLICASARAQGTPPSAESAPVAAPTETQVEPVREDESNPAGRRAPEVPERTAEPAEPHDESERAAPHDHGAPGGAETADGRAPATLSEKREMPDYDGRGGPPVTAGDVLLWVPRIVLVPPYFVSEYLIRRPLGWAIAGAERAGLPAALYSFFTFGPDNNAGVFPTAFIDFGFYPSVGVFAFYNDAFVEGHDLRLRGATWGKDWLAGSFASRVHIGDDALDVIALEGRGQQRPDYTYFGLGPDTRESAKVRFGMGELEAKTYVRRLYFRRSVVYAEVGVKSVDFTRGGLGTDPLLEDAVDAGATPAPPGYERGYTLFRSSVAATLDTRPTGPRPGSGMRLALGGGHAGELRTRTSFVRYGGSVTGFLDLNDRARVLSLGAGARFTDPIGRGEVPFTEQVTLGGDEPMRGFYEYRLIDRSAFVVDLGYRWPIWMWLDGTMHAEVGNVFGEHLSGFEAGKLRFSGSIGVEDTNPGDHRTQFLLGFGSETFESGGKIDSFRFLFGTTYGF